MSKRFIGKLFDNLKRILGENVFKYKYIKNFYKFLFDEYIIENQLIPRDVEIPTNNISKLYDINLLVENIGLNILLDKISDKYKNSINISGDIEYNNDKYIKQIFLVYKDKKLYDSTRNRKTYKYSNSEERAIILYDTITQKAYNGESYIEWNEDDEYFYKSNPLLSFEEEYEYVIKMCDNLKKESNGVINLYKSLSLYNASIQLFNDTTKNINADKIDYEEALWIQKASSGGFKFMDSKIQNPVIGYKCDVISQYPSILESKNFICPIKKGEYSIMTDENFNDLISKKIIPIGIYRVVINSINRNDDLYNRQFRFRESNYYSYVDVKTAIKLKFKLKLIQDGQANCLLYPRKTHCITGFELMKQFNNIIYPLKQKKIEGAKVILNLISGIFLQKNKRKRTVINNDDFEYVEDDIAELKTVPSKYNEYSTINYFVLKDDFYKSNFARVYPFLTATARSNMTDILIKYNSEILKVNTDGIISKTKLDLKYGCEIGEMKFEGSYLMNIINANIKEEILEKISD